MRSPNTVFPVWLARSKVNPIAQRVDVVPRNTLNARLNHSQAGAVTLIQAAAGYGKSTTLSSWRKSLLENGHNVAWLSVDKDENDPFQLLLYLAFSLSVAGIRVEESGLDAESILSDRPVRHLVNLMHGAIEDHQGKVVLILDDFENLEAEPVQTVIDPLFRFGPGNLHLAIASRHEGALKITDLELKGLAQRIGARDLKVSLTELKEFLPERIGAGLIRKIHAVTEGWPVAVQLLSTLIRARGDISEILAYITGNNRKMTAYLSEQVFDNLDEGVKSFLVDISVVDCIDADFANYLRDRDDSLEMLSALKDLDALVSPVDNINHSYRLHPLFREYLFDKLSSGERGARMQLRAGRWFAGRGELVRAIRHSVAGNDATGGGKLIEAAGGLMLWLKEGSIRLPRALALLPEPLIHQRPRLALIQCLLLMKTGKMRQARQLFESLASTGKQNSEPGFAYEKMVIQSLVYAYEGRRIPDELLAAIENSETEIPAHEDVLWGHHYTMLCGLNSFRGHLSTARRCGMRAICAFRSAKSKYGEIYIHIHLGDVDFCAGKASDSRQHYATAQKFARQHFGNDKAMRFIIQVLQAEHRYSANHLNLIPRSVDRYPRQLEDLEAWFNVYAAAYVLSSNVVFGRSGLKAALSILDDQKDFVTLQDLRRLQNLIAAQKINLLNRAGHTQEAAGILAESKLTLEQYKSDPGIGWRERDTVTQALIGLLILQGRVEKALMHLDYFLAGARQAGHARSCINYLILKSLAHHRLAEETRMLDCLRSALTLARSSDSVRLFLDQGEELMGILELLEEREEGGDNANLRFARTIRAQCGDGAREYLSLTKRELEVLRELQHGHPNKVIGRQIGISHNTVRYHLKNIFAKLSVDTRLKAVSAARQRQII